MAAEVIPPQMSKVNGIIRIEIVVYSSEFPFKEKLVQISPSYE